MSAQCPYCGSTLGWYTDDSDVARCIVCFAHKPIRGKAAAAPEASGKESGPSETRSKKEAAPQPVAVKEPDKPAAKPVQKAESPKEPAKAPQSATKESSHERSSQQRRR